MTECAQCGECCVNFSLNVDYVKAEQYVGRPDPRGIHWDWWLATGSKEEWRQSVIDYWLNVNYAYLHFQGGRETERFTCDSFDPTTKLCTDHENRPPLCRGYPWYGETPSIERAEGLPGQCSFRVAALRRQPVTIGATRGRD